MEWIFCKDRLPTEHRVYYVFCPQWKGFLFSNGVARLEFVPKIKDKPDGCISVVGVDERGNWIVDSVNEDRYPSDEDGFRPAWVELIDADSYYVEVGASEVLCWQPIPGWPEPPDEYDDGREN